MTSALRLKTVGLSNYRCFRDETLTLHPNVTVLLADNGGGKSATLDAIAAALALLIPSAMKNRPVGRPIGLQQSDAMSAEVIPPYVESFFPVSIGVDGWLYDSPTQWGPGLSADRTSFDTSVTSFPNEHVSHVFDEARFNADAELPVVAYYGTGRSIRSRGSERPTLGRLSRHFGFEGALDSAADFRQLSEWLAQAEWERNLHQTSDWDAALGAVYKATAKMLAPLGATGVSYSPEQQEFVVDFRLPGTVGTEAPPAANRRRVPTSSLSDGVRSVLALVADLSFRCAVLNAHLGSDAPELTDGVVLIDEIDMHLHPTWQSHIVNDLTEVFPRIQFVLTTHSPLVVSSVPNECVKLITSDGGGSTYTEVATHTEGASSDYLTTTVFNTSPRAPSKFTTALERLSAALAGTDLDAAHREGEVVRTLLDGGFDPGATKLLLELDWRVRRRAERADS